MLPTPPDKRLEDAFELIGYMSMALEISLPLMKSQRGKEGIEKALAKYRKWLDRAEKTR